MSGGAPLGADAIVGLLADEDRRRVVAALVLSEPGAAAGDLAAAAGLDRPRTWKALGRLESAGLVDRFGDDGFVLRADAFQQAARAAAAGRAPVTEADGPPEVAKVLRAFVRDGRLLSIPVVRAKRLVVLDVLAQEFEPGERYSEAQVNLMLGRWHADTASLRRYLVDEGFLDREDRIYWRSGGTVEPGDR